MVGRFFVFFYKISVAVLREFFSVLRLFGSVFICLSGLFESFGLIAVNVVRIVK